ncbi:uncharacterized protein LOC120667607 [Panicum virgatum]|uniref:uncharacterized protein LOC120667607 n=1 Tax=Panicum virgatum TaxID=38727 RepID=UPI0019D5E3EB|nr:uncharacterized protein LOC120667607 [Panicum virgatum]
MAPGLQADPGATPLGQSSGGFNVPRARRSGTGKRSLSSLSEAATKGPVRFAPTKALKTGARVTPHSALQPPTEGDQALEAEAAKLREAMARGAQAAQQTRAQEHGDDAGQSGAAAATWADVEEETGQGGAGSAARPDVMDGAGQGGAGGAAQPKAGDGGSSGDVQEHPASREEETPAPEPPRAGVEGATAAPTAPTASVAEQILVPEPARAGDEGAAAAATGRMAQENVVLVVELPLSEEYGESEDIDPVAAASAAARIAEFVSASDDVLGAGMSEGADHGASYAIVYVGAPSNFARIEREEDDAWRAHIVPPDFTHAERVEGDAWRAHMAIGAQIEEDLSRALNLLSRTHRDVNSLTFLHLQQLRSMSRDKSDRLTWVYARVHWLDRERDTQRATADQKVQEAELRQARAALEQKDQALEAKEAELQREKAAINTLTAALEEKDIALKEKEGAVQNAEAALKDKEASLSTLQEAARAQLEEARGSIAATYLRSLIQS